MAEKAKEELGVNEITVLADKGYYNGKCLKYCQESGITAIVSKQKTYNLKRVINIIGVTPLIDEIKAKMAKVIDVNLIQFCHFNI